MLSWKEIKGQVEEQSNNLAGGFKYYRQKAGSGIQYYRKKIEDAFSQEKEETIEQKDGSTICFERIEIAGYTMVDHNTGEVLDHPTGDIQGPPQHEDPLYYCLEQYSLLGYDAQEPSTAHNDEL